MKYHLANTTWDEAEYSAMQSVISTGNFTMGENVKQFETDFASKMGAKYSIMVNSGSSANLVAIAALFYKKENPLKRGDVVIVPTVSWSTTYHPLQQYGLKCRFVDIDPNTLNYDLNSLESAICPNTKLVVAVNLLGNPNDFNAINQIINNKNIYLFEDNCESLGAQFMNKKAGTFGIMGSYSTFFSHHISTMEGGLVTTDEEELYHIMLSLRSHGWTRHLPKNNLVTGTKSDDAFEESFKFVLPGFNLRPGELHGAIGIEQLKKLDVIIEERRKNAATFKSLFSKFDFLTIQHEIGESSWFGFSIILNKNCPFKRTELIKLFEKNQIEFRPIVTGNFLKNDVLKYYDYDVHGTTTNAEHLDENGLFIGNHHYDISSELSFTSELISKLT
ncbi:MAG: DegT/DnrJ/EryC1/StrS family aminotransferase [Flavobacteriales bacterium]|nr:DegT/DnrJ/EryC1/StrS family aminotransferase [Flavobacteriales bacterium]